MSINRVNISGNLTRDAEVRQTAGGLPVVGMGVAVNDRRRNAQTGEWEDVPNFVDCTFFGERAAKLAQYLVKGTKVCIEGKLRYSQWEKDGQRRSKLEVVVDEIEFMSRGQQQMPQQMPPQMQQQMQPPAQQQAYYAQQAMQAAQYPQAQRAQPAPDVYGEEIPF